MATSTPSPLSQRLQRVKVMAEEAGFTTKEMIVRLDAKLDHVIADHETRIRSLEATRSEGEGESTFKRWLTPVVVSTVGAAGWIVDVLHHAH